MQTLTDEQFKQKYGNAALNALKDAPQEQEKQTSFFDSIKNDLSQRAQNNEQILNDRSNNNVVGGLKLAANTAGGVGDVAGEALKRTPIVGGLLGAAGNAVKSGFNAITDKLSNTKFFKEAAAGSSPDSPIEQGLSTASSVGEIAGQILGADQGAGFLNKTKDIATTIPSKISGAVDSIPKPDLGGTGAYLKSAIKDVTGNVQDRIDHNIATALDLTPGDLKMIESKTGNQVGKWLSDNNLIPDAANKAKVQASIDAFKTQNFNAVRDEIAKVTKTYKPYQIPRLTDALKAIQEQIKGTVGLENDNALISNLLNKKDLTLGDVQQVKELLDEHFSLYKATGDVADNVTKQGLSNVRTGLKEFIENQVKDNTGSDIRQMNNNVSTARSLSDAITTRTGRGITRNMFNQRDIMMGMGLTYLGSPLLGVAAVLIKKLATSPTVRLRLARYLDQVSDAQKAKISEELQKGSVPAEVKSVVGDLN